MSVDSQIVPAQGLCTVQEACKVLSTSRTTLYQLFSERKLRPIKLRGRTMLERRDIEAFIEQAPRWSGRKAA